MLSSLRTILKNILYCLSITFLLSVLPLQHIKTEKFFPFLTCLQNFSPLSGRFTSLWIKVVTNSERLWIFTMQATHRLASWINLVEENKIFILTKEFVWFESLIIIFIPRKNIILPVMYHNHNNPSSSGFTMISSTQFPHLDNFSVH